MQVYLKRHQIFTIVHQTLKLLNKKYLLNKMHTISVLSILVDEMIKELKENKIINIPGFGKFIVRELKQRSVISVNTGLPVLTKKYNALRFVLDKKLHRTLTKEINECVEKKE